MRRLIQRFAGAELFEVTEPTSPDDYGAERMTMQSLLMMASRTKRLPRSLSSGPNMMVSRKPTRPSRSRLAVDDEPSTRLVAALDTVSTVVTGQNEQFPDRLVHDNVQFTVYRPKAVRPAKWYTMIAFAHLEERRPDAPESEPDPIEQVREQAKQILGTQMTNYRDVIADGRQSIPRAGEITFLPDVAGIEFNPERKVFQWLEDVHREEFRLQAKPELDGRTARGRLSVYLGVTLIAEVHLAIKVDGIGRPLPAGHPAETAEVSSIQGLVGPTSTTATAPMEPSTARPYRKVFASYSHKDIEIVRQIEMFARTLGDRYVRDVVDLRSGEAWDDRLLELVEEADVFQLFWSTNSMHSGFVRREWEHALSLNKYHFIRPTYWEDPLPETTDRSLPPETLRRLHFHRLQFGPFLPKAGANEALASTPAPSVKQGEKDIFDDTDFEVDVPSIDADSDDKTVQLEDASDFDLEDSDTGSEVFAIDEEAVDQNASTAMAPSAFAEDEDEDDDDGFDSAVSSEMTAGWSSSESSSSPERSSPAMVLTRDSESRPSFVVIALITIPVLLVIGFAIYLFASISAK